jgi:uncharacterized protein
MTYELLELVFYRIDEYLREYQEEQIALTWHGGEICLLGAEYFRKAYELQEKNCPTTKSRIEHLVQSNLTLMNKEILDALRQLGIEQIGSSFEPLPHLRGFGPNRDSDAYNHAFMRGVNLLNEHHICWGVIYVVHRGSLEKPLDIFNYLTNLNLQTQPNINAVWVFGKDKHNLAITPEEYADFLGAIFPVWWKHRQRYPKVKPFCGLVDYVIEKNQSLVCESSGVCSNRWIYIGPEGNTSQCGKAGDYNFMSYGKIQERSIKEILNDPQRNQIAERQLHLPLDECSGCRLWGICHGGCPLDSFQAYGDFKHRTPNCAATKRFIEKYFEPITGYHIDATPSVRIADSVISQGIT